MIYYFLSDEIIYVLNSLRCEVCLLFVVMCVS